MIVAFDVKKNTKLQGKAIREGLVAATIAYAGAALLAVVLEDLDTDNFVYASVIVKILFLAEVALISVGTIILIARTTHWLSKDENRAKCDCDAPSQACEQE